MAWITALAWLLAFEAQLSYQISRPKDKEYVAAVVEYTPSEVKENGTATVFGNALAYQRYIKEAGEADADIIVFPEDGLTTMNFPEKTQMDSWTTFIPSPADDYTPCKQDSVPVSSAFKALSCAAMENRIYVVINIAEKVKRCTDEKCSEHETIYHNTNVVFDRAGKVIARYRKVNLFDEEQFNVTAVPEMVKFVTDFGVTFGMFICFDILFHVPALNLTRQHGVTDFVYSTAWFSELPFLTGHLMERVIFCGESTADQTQFGWAYSENVNLLAAGYNRPRTSTTGSGIYLGRRGIAAAVYSREEGGQLLIGRVPKIDRKAVDGRKTEAIPDIGLVNGSKEEEKNASGENVHFHLQDDITRFNSVIVDGPLEQRVCQDGFCCSFRVNASSFEPTVKYRIAVFNGRRHYGRNVEVAVQVCGLIQCANDSLDSCTSTKRSKTTFSTIEIAATFHDYKTNLVMPSTLNSSVLPFTSFSYDEHTHDDHVHITMVLSKPTKDIVTFGLYGRIISQDAEATAEAIRPSLHVIFSLALGLLLAFRPRA